MHEKNDTIKLIMDRRSCKSYRPQVPSREDLAAVVETARYAPSGMNRQLCHFYVITDQALLGRLTALVSEKLESFADKDFRYAAPALVVVCNRKDCGTALQDASCAMENMMLAACSMGLGSRWVNQLYRLSDDPDLRALLAPYGYTQEEFICASLAIGWPDVPPDPKPRTGNPVTWVEG